MSANDDPARIDFGTTLADDYDRLMVPLIFDAYALEIAARVAKLPHGEMLEVAAGTGALTRRLAVSLPDAAITATDLSEAMLEVARRRSGPHASVRWRQADAAELPFEEAAFDLAVCQFGVMFFPDKVTALGEIWRVLRPGGWFVFSVWDRIEANDFVATIDGAMTDLYAADPPRFIREVPHGYHDRAVMARDLALAGFGRKPTFHAVDATSRAGSPRDVVTAYMRGTPLGLDIASRQGARPEDAMAAAERAIESRFGGGEVVGRIRADIVAVRK